MTFVSGPRNMSIPIIGILPWLYLVALGKESIIDKQERGVENYLLQVIFYLRDFHLASYASVIDIGVIDIVLTRHITSFTHS